MPAARADRSDLRRRLAAAKEWAAGRTRTAQAVCQQTLAGLKAGLLGMWRLRRQRLTAVAMGAVVGLAAYLAGPWLSALAGGLTGGTLSFISRAQSWLQRLLPGGSGT